MSAKPHELTAAFANAGRMPFHKAPVPSFVIIFFNVFVNEEVSVFPVSILVLTVSIGCAINVDAVPAINPDVPSRTVDSCDEKPLNIPTEERLRLTIV